jgi:menaquinol-cytochrome c reductase iron-sulfur subunit
MDRRSFLAWATNGMGALFATVLGVPAALYLLDPLNRKAPDSSWRTVANLDDLQQDVPFEAVLQDTRWDAWNLYPNEIVGRVWLIRHDDGHEDKVKAFTSVCPHLGCSVNWLAAPAGEPATSGQFLCPCHGGRFDHNGQRVEHGPATNPAPRNMDSLEVQIVPDQDNPSNKVVQVKYLRFQANQERKDVAS